MSVETGKLKVTNPKILKTIKKEKEKEEAIVKAFNVDDFLVSDEIQEKTIEGLGKVTFKFVGLDDFLIILRETQTRDSNELGLAVIYRMLNKADPNVTWEKIKRLDPAIGIKLIQELAGFLASLEKK